MSCQVLVWSSSGFFFLHIISRLFEDLSLKKGTECQSHMARNETLIIWIC